MKKADLIPFFVLIIASVTLVMCKKDTVSNGNTDKKTKTTNSFRMSTIRSQMVSYTTLRGRGAYFRSLTPQDQYNLYIDKLYQAISTGISIQKKNLIQDVINNISVSVYADPIARQNFKNTFLANWLITAKTVFPIQEGTLIFGYPDDFDPNNLNGGIVAGGSGGGGGSNDCDCDQSSAFGACQLLNSECKNQSCSGSAHGCGFMGLYSCNGVCAEVEPSTSNPQSVFYN